MTAYKGLGTYGNAVGVVAPLDHKLSNAAMVVKQSGNLIRPGLFWGGNATIVTGKANMSYDVAAYSCATTRGATSGAVFGGNDGVLNVATTAAPGSNSRYDVIYHWHREYSLDGVDSNPVIGVIQGTAAASPTVPSLSAFPGAIEIARVLVPAGVTATNTGTTIAQTAPFTAMAGGAIIFRTATERDAATVVAGTRGRLLTDNSEWVSSGTSWAPLTPGLNSTAPTSATGGTIIGVGKVTFSGAASVNVRGVFSSAFDNYRVVISTVNSVSGTTVGMQLAASGTANTTGYDTVTLGGQGGATGSGTTLNAASWAPFAGSQGVWTAEIMGPFLTAQTMSQGVATVTPNPGTAPTMSVSTYGALHRASYSADGIVLTFTGGTGTGSIHVYGYND